MRLLMARFCAGRARFAAGLLVGLTVFVFLRTLFVWFAGHLICDRSRVSGKTLPLLGHQALQLARHDLPEIYA
jgi:hypothetical protein